ncbi:MAG: N-acetylmuramoyl-L-alanine amidase, partial [Candidatus Sumerlaeia bacterium]|nr:N-acetylmuramoyl-L-alanine amidase [Candidatus Sumerlaeia bacterium]
MGRKAIVKCLCLVAFLLLVVVALWAAGSWPQPTICNRTCWGARNGTCTATISSLNRAVIHHTAGASDYNVTNIEESKAKVRAIQNYHMDVNGWCDIGYHFLVDKLGNIFEGRKNSMTGLPRGAHDGVNDNSFGFSNLGYFHSPYNHTPTLEMRNALYNVIAWRIPDP